MDNNFSREFKLATMRELDAGNPVAVVCRQHELKKDLVYRWLREYRKDPANAFAGKGMVSTVEARNAELERMVGRLYEENQLLKKVLQNLERLRTGNK